MENLSFQCTTYFFKEHIFRTKFSQTDNISKKCPKTQGCSQNSRKNTKKTPKDSGKSTTYQINQSLIGNTSMIIPFTIYLYVVYQTQLLTCHQLITETLFFFCGFCTVLKLELDLSHLQVWHLLEARLFHILHRHLERGLVWGQRTKTLKNLWIFTQKLQELTSFDFEFFVCFENNDKAKK